MEGHLLTAAEKKYRIYKYALKSSSIKWKYSTVEAFQISLAIPDYAPSIHSQSHIQHGAKAIFFSRSRNGAIKCFIKYFHILRKFYYWKKQHYSQKLLKHFDNS